MVSFLITAKSQKADLKAIQSNLSCPDFKNTGTSIIRATKWSQNLLKLRVTTLLFTHLDEEKEFFSLRVSQRLLQSFSTSSGMSILASLHNFLSINTLGNIYISEIETTSKLRAPSSRKPPG